MRKAFSNALSWQGNNAAGNDVPDDGLFAVRKFDDVRAALSYKF
jgi:hypothetical protein